MNVSNNDESPVSAIKKGVSFFEHPETISPVNDISFKRDTSLPLKGILKSSTVQDPDWDPPLSGMAPEGCYFL